jgi:hypothetical protein
MGRPAFKTFLESEHVEAKAIVIFVLVANVAWQPIAYVKLTNAISTNNVSPMPIRVLVVSILVVWYSSQSHLSLRFCEAVKYNRVGQHITMIR